MRRKSIRTVAAAGAVLVACSLPFAAAVPAQAAPAGTVGTESVHRVSFTCSKPAGQKANYSWSDGIETTTVYYNNHCSQALKVTLHRTGTPFGNILTCWSTPTKKGSIKFIYGLSAITKGC